MGPKEVQRLALLKTYGLLREDYTKIYEELSRTRDVAKGAELSMEELVDRLYILREMSKLLVDLRKEADGVGFLIEKLCCIMWVQKYTNCPEKVEPIRAEYATGTPKTGMSAKIPKLSTDPHGYRSLLNFFGVKEEFIDLEILRPHWPSMKQYLTELSEEGKPLPDGVTPDATYPTYSVAVRAKRDLDEELERETDGKD